VFTIHEIADALAGHAHEPADFRAQPTHAAVAMVLSGSSTNLEACFIRRAEKAGDPWSGQVALPGGRASSSDPDAAAVAERETWEETGLTLARHQQIGALPVHSITRHGPKNSLTLSPFVYYLGSAGRASGGSPQTPVPNDEVDEIFWVPVAHLFDESTTTTLEWPPGSGASSFPGIAFQHNVIWGLTLRILETFADLMQRDLPALR
jgi:8-oxo-dGTP pyrophosphatase MutT (NUDIX family)